MDLGIEYDAEGNPRFYATIAYVRAGKGREYVKLLAPLNLTVVVDELEYLDSDKQKGYFELHGLRNLQESIQYRKDAAGHEHKEKGQPGGGQFTGEGTGGDGSEERTPERPSAESTPSTPGQPEAEPISPHTAEVLKRLPPAAYSRLASRVTRFEEAPTMEAVTDAWYAGEPNPPPPGKWIPCYGFYDPTDGRLMIGPGGPNVDRAGTLAHELSHALDQSDDRKHFDLSGHPEFVRAWRDEMGRGQLSNYARTDEVEGFAELGRALWGSDVDQSKIEAQFPRCCAYFRKQGLLE